MKKPKSLDLTMPAPPAPKKPRLSPAAADRIRAKADRLLKNG